MPNPSIKLEPTEFKSWNSPHLLTNQFQLLAKFIQELNTNVPPEKFDVTTEMQKELELKIINAFNHQMMPSWFALAKSYYPFYNESACDKALIEALEQKLNIKVSNYNSLPELIKKVFLTKYPTVNSQYQPYIDNIEIVMAKLTAVALSTPALINDAHQRDHKQFEGAAPSMSNCIGPIETMLRQMISKTEFDKSFIISATSLLLQVKAIKSHFEQITVMQQLENIQKENKKLQEQLNKHQSGMQNQSSHKGEENPEKVLLAWQSKEEQLALVKIFKLQKKMNQYYDHLTDFLVSSPENNLVSTKRTRITEMKNTLDKEHLLPTQRIKMFTKQLEEAKEQLKEHRDPMWIRLLRDCLRILALTFSGIALYRKLSNQPVNFFKPSHGQIFVEEVNRITTGHQGMS